MLQTTSARGPKAPSALSVIPLVSRFCSTCQLSFLPFACSNWPTCLLPVRTGQLPSFTLPLASACVKRRRPGAQSPLNHAFAEISGILCDILAACWSDLSDFLGHLKRIKKSRFFGSRQKAKKSRINGHWTPPDRIFDQFSMIWGGILASIFRLFLSIEFA